MVNPDGINITEVVLNYHQYSITSSNTKWSLQCTTSTSARQLWKKKITKVYQLNGTERF